MHARTHFELLMVQLRLSLPFSGIIVCRSTPSAVSWVVARGGGRCRHVRARACDTNGNNSHPWVVETVAESTATAIVTATRSNCRRRPVCLGRQPLMHL